MRRIGVAVALCAVALPSTALAKGPTHATITGPGLAGPLTLGGPRGWTQDSPMAALTNGGGFFQVAWGGAPGQIRANRPTKRLGPRYRVAFLVPGPTGKDDRIRQDVYPFAHGGPVTYTPAGQTFFGTRRTQGGWFRAAPELTAKLVAAGLPRPGPRATLTAVDSDEAPTLALAALVLVLAFALAGATAIALRRRARPEPA